MAPVWHTGDCFGVGDIGQWGWVRVTQGVRLDLWNQEMDLGDGDTIENTGHRICECRRVCDTNGKVVNRRTVTNAVCNSAEI